MDRFRILGAGLVAIVFVGAVSTAASAQGDTGFLRGKGHTDIGLSYASDTYRAFWVGSQKVHDPNVGRISRRSLNFYGAYGIDERTDLVVNASYVDVGSNGNPVPVNGSERQLQDSSIGLKYKVNEWHLGPGAVSLFAAPAVKIPLSHYSSNAITAIGDGQIDYRGRAIVQYTANCGAFFAVETGFDYRTEGPPNEIPLNLTLGVPVTKYATITPFFSLVKSRGDDDIGQVPFPAVQEEYQRWGISAYVRVNEQVGVTVGWRDTIDGRNTGDATGYWLGVIFKF